MDHQTPFNCALLEDLQLAIADFLLCSSVVPSQL